VSASQTLFNSFRLSWASSFNLKFKFNIDHSIISDKIAKIYLSIFIHDSQFRTCPETPPLTEPRGFVQPVFLRLLRNVRSELFDFLSKPEMVKFILSCIRNTRKPVTSEMLNIKEYLGKK
jgi:hypothetical protein